MLVQWNPYSHDRVTGAAGTPLSAGFRAGRQRDLERGTTLLGPHRDDFSIFSNEIDLCTYGSRGQIRTALLTLKLAEVQWMSERNGTAPLLLLDETLAELDEKRSSDLLDWLTRCGQAILTTTDQTHFPADFLAANTLWTVHGGCISKGSSADAG